MIDPAPGGGSERVGRTDRPSVASSIPSSLASLQPDNELRVSTLELFFDLVFVLTITQLAAQLSNQPSPTGALRVCLIFIVVFWMHAGYVLLTNQVPPVSITRRLLLIGGMAGFFVCAVAIPRAFIDTSTCATQA